MRQPPDQKNWDAALLSPTKQLMAKNSAVSPCGFGADRQSQCRKLVVTVLNSIVNWSRLFCDGCKIVWTPPEIPDFSLSNSGHRVRRLHVSGVLTPRIDGCRLPNGDVRTESISLLRDLLRSHQADPRAATPSQACLDDTRFRSLDLEAYGKKAVPFIALQTGGR